MCQNTLVHAEINKGVHTGHAHSFMIDVMQMDAGLSPASIEYHDWYGYGAMYCSVRDVQ